MADPRPGPGLAAALATVDGWGARTVAVAVVGAGGEVLATRGPSDAVLPWASVTKPVTALAVLGAVQRGLLALDDPAGPPGSTVRHLLAHAAGLAPDGPGILGVPGRYRVYSNAGFDLLGELLAAAAGAPFADVMRAWVLEPLGMRSARLAGPPSAGLEGSLADLAAVAGELLAPRVFDRGLLAEAMRVQFPGIPGVVPGFGLQAPNDWGLGLEIRGRKAPHWTGTRNAPETVGHFGRSGTFLWVDRPAALALACLTDRPFGSWATEAWPALSDAVLAGAGAA